MTTYTDESAAADHVRRANRLATQIQVSRDLTVIVDGPEDGEVTVMALPEAIDAGFLYRWEV